MTGIYIGRRRTLPCFPPESSPELEPPRNSPPTSPCMHSEQTSSKPSRAGSNPSRAGSNYSDIPSMPYTEAKSSRASKTSTKTVSIRSEVSSAPCTFRTNTPDDFTVKMPCADAKTPVACDLIVEVETPDTDGKTTWDRTVKADSSIPAEEEESERSIEVSV